MEYADQDQISASSHLDDLGNDSSGRSMLRLANEGVHPSSDIDQRTAEEVELAKLRLILIRFSDASRSHEK